MRQGAPKIILAVYLVVLMLPIYWLINMSLRTNSDIMSGMALWPHNPTFEKYFQIFNDPTWVHGFGVSLTYVGDQHRHFGRWWRCRPLTRSTATPSSATSTCSSGS